MSHAITFIPLRAAIVNAILTESRETTDAYVKVLGTSVVCPPAMNLALRLKLTPIFTSKMRWLALHFVVSDWNITLGFLPCLECRANVPHLLKNGIPPHGVAILKVKSSGFLNSLRNFDTELVSPHPILGLQLGDDAIPLFQGIWNTKRRQVPPQFWLRPRTPQVGPGMTPLHL